MAMKILRPQPFWGILAAICIGLAILYHLFFYVYLGIEPGPFEITLVSPDQRASFHLTESVDRCMPPQNLLCGHADQNVKMTYSLDGIVQFQDQKLWSGDWLDFRFGGRYPNREWVSDTVLKFQMSLRPEQTFSSDLISVANRSGKEIAFLRVTAGNDMFVIANLKSNETLTLQSESQSVKGGSIFVEGWGRFMDQNFIRVEGAELPVRGNEIEHHLLVVNNDGIVISSSDDNLTSNY